jgi:hypothetical protein
MNLLFCSNHWRRGADSSRFGFFGHCADSKVAERAGIESSHVQLCASRRHDLASKSENGKFSRELHGTDAGLGLFVVFCFLFVMISMVC